MGSDFAGNDGEISDEHIKYYELRARGGTGLIIVENICVKYPEGSDGTTQLRINKDSYIRVCSRLPKPVTGMGRAWVCSLIMPAHPPRLQG